MTKLLLIECQKLVLRNNSMGTRCQVIGVPQLDTRRTKLERAPLHLRRNILRGRDIRRTAFDVHS